MRVNELVKDDWLKVTDLENMFDVETDINNRYTYNLNQALYINISDNLMSDYNLQCDMFWPLISYKIYGTTRLAWLLMKLNKVQAEDIFNNRKAGTSVKYIDPDYIQTIVKQVNGYDDN